MGNRGISLGGLIVLLLLLASFGPSPEEQAATAAALTAAAATNMPTPTSTPSPPPTHTPTPTQTLAPTTIPRLTDTALPVRDLSSLITADDVPKDFEMAAGGPLFLGIVPIEETFAFYDQVVREAIIGSAMLVPSQQDKMNFDALVLNKASFMFFVLSQIESDLEPEGPLDIGEVGDISYAYAAVESGSENQFHWDAVIFRRNDVGVIVAYLYLVGNEPVLSLDEIATILDNHILANPEFRE